MRSRSVCSNVDFHIVRIKGKNRFDVGIHLLSTQICCKSDKKKKVSNNSCAFLYCAVRFAFHHTYYCFSMERFIKYLNFIIYFRFFLNGRFCLSVHFFLSFSSSNDIEKRTKCTTYHIKHMRVELIAIHFTAHFVSELSGTVHSALSFFIPSFFLRIWYCVFV